MLPNETDKTYWHLYTDIYREKVFSNLPESVSILEYGVLEGNSIRLLMDTFPSGQIVGADIAHQQKNWPVGERVSYVEVDQGDRGQLQKMFSRLGREFNLIIDDGSHIPCHQYNCLMESFPFITSPGFYIMEDVYDLYKERKHDINCLHVLLAIEHLGRVSRSIDPHIEQLTGKYSYFSPDDIIYLARSIESVHLYRRTLLPTKCYNCGRSEFDYLTLRCICGRELYEEINSMAFIIKKR